MSGKPVHNDRQEFSRIVARMLDVEQLNEEDFLWLVQRLREDDEALSEYLKLVDLDARLRWTNFEGQSIPAAKSRKPLKSSISAAIAASESQREELDSAVPRRTDRAVVSSRQQPWARHSNEKNVDSEKNLVDQNNLANRSKLDGRKGLWKTRWAIAGAVAVAVLLLLSTQNWSRRGPAGTLMQSAGAKWSEPHENIVVGEEIGGGRRTMTEGVAEIALSDGTRLVVEAPSTFELVSTDTALLERGNLSVFVAPKTTGYTVETPDARIMDLGTAFQVNVDRDGTEVHVIEGEVVANGTHVLADQQAGKLRLHYRDAVAFHRRDGKVEPVEFVGEQLKFHGDLPLSAIPRKVSGDIRCLETAPTSVAVGEFEHDNEIYLFLEQSDVLMEKTIYADRSANGETVSEDGNLNMRIAAGTRVNSYLLHFDPKVDSADVPVNRVAGTVTFRTPIIGVFTRNVSLRESDRQLRSSQTTYMHGNNPGGRGLNGDDFVSFSPDRKTLIVSFQSNRNADQIRIVTTNEFQ